MAATPHQRRADCGPNHSDPSTPIAVGAAAYVLMLLIVSRDTLREVLSLIRQRAPNVAAPA